MELVRQHTKNGQAAAADPAGFAIHSTRRMSEPWVASGFAVSEVGSSVRAWRPTVMKYRHGAPERNARRHAGAAHGPAMAGVVFALARVPGAGRGAGRAGARRAVPGGAGLVLLATIGAFAALPRTGGQLGARG
jgi:hypothetical protein